MLRSYLILVLANSPNCCSGQYDTPATCPSSGVAYYSYFSESSVSTFMINSNNYIFLQRATVQTLTHMLMMTLLLLKLVLVALTQIIPSLFVPLRKHRASYFGGGIFL